MTLFRWRNITFIPIALSLFILLLSACSSGSQSAQSAPTPTPSPTPTQGQQLLTTTGNLLTSARTLQGMLHLKVTGQSFNGTLNTSIWNANPAKSRTEVHQSTLSQSPAGSVTVSDGKKQWLYNPAKNTVYSGPAQQNTSNSVFGSAGGTGGGQSQVLLNVVQSVFTSSIGTLKSSASTVNGRAVYDVGVVSQDTTGGTNSSVGTTGGGAFSYTGDAYIDKITHLPVEVKLNIQGFGSTILDFAKLVLNQPIPASTFTFVAPAGAKELPLQQATPTANGDLIPLSQAQQQAGFHLLSIPGDQADYVLLGVNALGTPGDQIYTLHYMKGNTSFTIAQGKPLAHLTTDGQRVNLRNTTAFFSNQSGGNVLSWTEKNVGINITGLNQQQAVPVAQSLT